MWVLKFLIKKRVHVLSSSHTAPTSDPAMEGVGGELASTISEDNMAVTRENVVMPMNIQTMENKRAGIDAGTLSP